jgi:hypothetical protein
MEVPNMAELAPLSHPLPVWVDVLDHIEGALRQTLEQAIEPSALPEPGEVPGSAALRALDDRLASWQGYVDRVSLDTEDADTLAAREEADLTVLIQIMHEAREKLVKWTKPAI